MPICVDLLFEANSKVRFWMLFYKLTSKVGSSNVANMTASSEANRVSQ
jgi:hypothetical protein